MPINIASGALSLEYSDLGIRGRVNLTWERSYSSASISAPVSPLGQAWSSDYFSTLTVSADGFEFASPTGTATFSIDPQAVLVHGGRAISYGTFSELFRDGEHLVVQKWSVDTGAVWRYYFLVHSADAVKLLSSYQDACGQGLDLQWSQGQLIAIRQRLEKRLLLLGYSSAGMVESVTFAAPSGFQQVLMTYEYDANKRLIAAVDVMGNADRYEYDGMGRLTREIVKDGGVFTFRYDKQSRCVRSSGLDRYDEKTISYFEATGHSEVSNSYGHTTWYKYNSAGQVLEERDPLGGTKARSYDDYGRPKEKVNENGATVKFEYDAQGNRSKIIDPLGNEFDYRFNYDHMIVETRAPNGNAWLRAYDPTNRMIASRDPLGGQWNVAYAEDGMVQSIVDPNDHARHFRFRDGLLVQMSDSLGNWSTFNHDDFGRVTKAEDPLGRLHAYAYDMLGNPTQITMPGGASVRMAYDSVGNPIQYTDAEGHTVRYLFGPCNRLLAQQDRNGNATRYSWRTESEQLETITNEVGEIFNLTWDECGRLVKKKSFDGVESTFRYDPAGDVIGVVNGAGEEQLLRRDISGREISRELSTGEVHSFLYDVLGNVIEARVGNHVVELVRDALGRITTEKQGADSVKTDYDSVGNSSRLVSSRGDDIAYRYDSNNDLQAVLFNHRDVFSFERDANGREISRLLPSGEALFQTYNDQGVVQSQRLMRRRLADGFVGELVRRDYSYDMRNLLRSVSDSGKGLIQYDYDPTESLVGVTETGRQETYQLDRTQNITRIEIDDGDSETVVDRAYGPGNRLLQSDGTRYEYDSNGRLILKVENDLSPRQRAWQYKWNALSQLVSIVTPEGTEWRYSYDAFGRRTAKVGPTTAVSYIWNEFTLLHEIEAGTQESTAWIFEPRSFRPLAQVKNGEFQSIICDTSGTPKELVNEAGQIIRIENNSWGQPLGSTSRERQCSIGFQGQYYDKETGLYYNRFRYYDPNCGRFISQDPRSVLGGLNLYLYCRNPLQDVDPFGLDSQKLDRALGGKPDDGHQAHHVIPEGVLNDYPELTEKLEPLGYDRDHKANGILMPSDDEKAMEKGQISHRGSHPKYNREIDAKVKDINDRLASGEILPEQAFDELKKLQKEYKKRIKDGDPTLPRSDKFPCKLG
jgi:RHS repeat-associated protein